MAGAVAGVVSAFCVSVDFYRNWRDKQKQQRLNVPRNQSLENSHTLGQSTVRTVFDQKSARLGPGLQGVMVTLSFCAT